MKKTSQCLIALFISTLSYAHEQSKIVAQTYPDPEPPRQGLYSLDASQMPGPFFSFGQNIIGKDIVITYFVPGYQKTSSANYLDLIPSFVYGFSENASLYLVTPWALNYRDNEGNKSSGFSDSTAQLEYAFYDTCSLDSCGQATIVGGISYPTGSYNKSPPTSDGASNYLLGTTYNYTSLDWLWFISPGVQVSSKKNGVLPGPQYLYQFGIGHDIFSVKDKYIFAFVTEFDGQYGKKDRYRGELDHDSGGNTIYVTPSLWFSTNKLTLQLGVSLPVVQHLFGEQDKSKYYLSGTFGWTFN